jgi:DNA-directed RNA polymerase subunit K/omega
LKKKGILKMEHGMDIEKDVSEKTEAKKGVSPFLQRPEAPKARILQVHMTDPIPTLFEQTAALAERAAQLQLGAKTTSKDLWGSPYPQHVARREMEEGRLPMGFDRKMASPDGGIAIDRFFLDEMLPFETHPVFTDNYLRSFMPTNTSKDSALKD